MATQNKDFRVKNSIIIASGSSDEYTLPTADGTANQVISTDGNGTLTFTNQVSGGIDNVVDDTTPQLGGNLDVNGNSIVSVSNGDITLAPNGTGNVLLTSDLVFEGATANSFETTLTVTDPTADRTITFKDATGTVAFTSDISLSALSVTATAAELNVLDGITASTSELNIIDGVTATTTEINTLDGFTGFTLDNSGDLLIVGTDGTSIDSSDLLNIDTTNGRLGIGTSSPARTLHLVGDTQFEGSMRIDQYHSSEDGPDIIFVKARGTPSAPVAVQTSDELFKIAIQGYDGSNYITRSRIVSDAQVDGSTYGADLAFQTGNGAAPSTRFYIAKDGAMTMTGDVTVADGTYDLDVASHDGTNGLKLGGTLVTATAAEINILDGVTASTTELNYLDGITGITLGDAAETLIVGTDGTSITTTDLLAFDTTNNRVGIGTTSPATKFHIAGEGSNEGQIRLQQANNGSDGPDIAFYTSRGTIASPSAVQNGDTHGRLNPYAYNGTSFLQTGSFGWSGTDGTGNNTFDIRSRSGGTLAKRLEVLSGGDIRFADAYTFPTADGSANQVLLTDGSGNIDFGTVAYANISGTPTIPTSLSELTNDAGFITSADTYNFNVAADDSTQRVVGDGESIRFLGTTGISTTSNAEGDITIAGNIDGLGGVTLGTQNEILIVGAGGNTVTSTDTLTIDDTNNYIGINQTSPAVTLHMTGESSQSAQIRMEQHDNSGDAPDIRTKKSRGTAAAPTKNNAGDFIFRGNFERYNGTSYTNVGQLAVDTNSTNADRFQLTLTVSEDGTSIDASDAQIKIDGNDSGAITFNGAYKFPTADGNANQVLVTNGSGTLSFATQASGGIDNVSEDTTPQLGGNLDVNGNSIVSASNGDIEITPNGTGQIGLHGAPQSDIKTHIRGTGEFRVGSYFATDDRDFISLQADGTNSDIRANNNKMRFYNDQGDMEFYTNGTPGTDVLRLTIEDGGDIVMADTAADFNLANHDAGTNGLKLGGTLVTASAAEINILDGVTATTSELNIIDGVTATTSELNIMDGNTSATATTIVDADRVVLNDAGTMKQVAVTDLNTYFKSTVAGGSNEQVQYNNSGALAGSSNFTWDNDGGADSNGLLTSQNISVTNRLSLGGSGAQFFAFNEDTIKVKFANWYSSNSRQYGQGQLWYEIFFVAADDTDSSDNRRIGFYLEEPNNGASDADDWSGSGAHPTNPTFFASIDAFSINYNNQLRLHEDATGQDIGTNYIALQQPSSLSANRTLTLPDATDTLVGRATTDTLTNKTLTSPTVSGLYLSDSSIQFEGSSANANETTLTVTNPTADRTVTIPDATGTVVLTATGDVNLDTVHALTNGATIDIDATDGGIQYVTVGQNTTYTFNANWQAGHRVTLMIAQSTAYTHTWPTMKWAGGVAPTFGTNGDYNTVEIWRIGTTYYGAYVGNHS